MTRKFRFLTALTACAVCSGLLTAYPCSAEGTHKNLLILGDSISSGYGLSNGQYGFYDYLVECTDMTMTNLAVAGAKTSDLLDLIATAKGKKAVAAADTICISIGGNDVLSPTLKHFDQFRKENEGYGDMFKRLSKDSSFSATDVMFDLTDLLRQPIKTANANIAQIEKDIRAINADAEVIFQTIYNPVDLQNSTYQGEDYSSSYESLKNYIKNQLAKINKVISGLSSTKTADIAARFVGTGWVYTNSLSKDIHPTPTGHALIAAELLDAMDCSKKQSKMILPTMSKLKEKDFLAIPTDDYFLLMKYSDGCFGDVDGDGLVLEVDAVMVLKEYGETILENPTTLDNDQKMRANILNGSPVNDTDATMILQYFAQNSVLETPTAWSELQ